MLSKIALASLAVAAAEAVALSPLRGHQAGALLIRIRSALFTRYTDSAQVLAEQPQYLIQRGFLVDAPAEISTSGARIVRLAGLSGELMLIRGLRSAQDRDMALVHLLGSGLVGPADRCCGCVEGLVEKTRLVRRGLGCCSDYVQVFLLLSSQVGLTAREVTWEVHTVAEYWDAEAGAWVFVDPQYAILAAGPDSRLLSVLEVRQRLLAARPITWVFFGTGRLHWASTHGLGFRHLYASDVMRDYLVMFGNNVLAQHSREARLAPLPKPVRQLLIWLAGVRPGYLALRDNYSAGLARSRLWLRGAVILNCLLLVSGLMAGPVRRVLGLGRATGHSVAANGPTCRSGCNRGA